MRLAHLDEEKYYGGYVFIGIKIRVLAEECE